VIAVTGQKGGSWSKEEWMMAGRRQEWGDDIEIVFFWGGASGRRSFEVSEKM
jgi:hypothetical protein